MGRRLPTGLAILALWAATALPGAAGDGATQPGSAREDTVRVYTNADLLKFGPPPDADDLGLSREDPGWEFVVDFLEREYARLDADRAHELEQRRVEIEERRVAERRDEPSLGLAWPYALRYPYGHAYRADQRRDQARHRSERRTHAPSGNIVPLHARPTPGVAHRERVIRQAEANPR